jgi:hypothetical protein
MEGIRPNTRTALTAFKDSQDVFNARNEEGQRRLCAPLIQTSLDGLVHMPEHIRAHIVIEHPQTMAGRARLFQWHPHVSFAYPARGWTASVRHPAGG